jgi:hypothetical protein
MDFIAQNEEISERFLSGGRCALSNLYDDEIEGKQEEKEKRIKQGVIGKHDKER